jgi:hypothetical protein
MRRMIIALAVLLLAGFLPAAAEGKKVYHVTVKEAQIRAKASYLAGVLDKLKYLDAVSAVKADKGWALVDRPSGRGQGWINLSALTDYQGKLKSGKSAGTGASSGEVAAAGKGFSAQVEKEYQRETNLDYSWVDRVEKYTVSPSRASAFLRAGGLNDGLGGEE